MMIAGKRNDCPSVAENGAYFAHFAECCALLFLGIPVGAVVSVTLLAQLVDYKVQGENSLWLSTPISFPFILIELRLLKDINTYLNHSSIGMGQGLGRLCSSLGMVIGPLWAGWQVYNPAMLYGAAIIIICVELVSI